MTSTGQSHSSLRKWMGFVAAALVGASCGATADLMPPESGGPVGKEGASARFNQPEGIFYDGEDTLFIADSEGQTIRKMVLSTGTVTTLAGSPGVTGSADGTGADARFYLPWRIVGDGEGGLFVSDQFNSTIRRVVIATGAVTTFAGSPGERGSIDGVALDARFDGPDGLATDGTGNLFVVDRGNGTIRKIVIATGLVTTVAGLAGKLGNQDGVGEDALFCRPAGLVSDGEGHLFVADEYNNAIRKIVIASGAVTTLAGQDSPTVQGSNDGTGMQARFDSPSDVAIDGKGNLFVADKINDMIRKIVIATGWVTTVAGSPSNRGGGIDGIGARASFDWPKGIAADGKGNLFVSDGTTLRRVNATTGVVVTIAGRSEVAGTDDSHPSPGS